MACSCGTPHLWKARVADRALSQADGCPVCSGALSRKLSGSCITTPLILVGQRPPGMICSNSCTCNCCNFWV